MSIATNIHDKCDKTKLKSLQLSYIHTCRSFQKKKKKEKGINVENKTRIKTLFHCQVTSNVRNRYSNNIYKYVCHFTYTQTYTCAAILLTAKCVGMASDWLRSFGRFSAKNHGTPIAFPFRFPSSLPLHCTAGRCFVSAAIEMKE